jgi:ribulose-phosphate 3-epimerase
MKPIIVPGVIAKTQGELDEMLKKVEGTAKRIMLDVMDGEFVSNTSLDFDFKVPADSNFEYEAHLMTRTPLEWIEKNGNKVDIAVMQVETLEDIGKAIEVAKGKGLKVILALNPETGLDRILSYLDAIYAVLILTVNPGSFCVEFLPETLEKIKNLREIDKKIPIEVDGCMNQENARLAKDAGATIFASGSYVMKSDDPERAIKELEEAVK